MIGADFKDLAEKLLGQLTTILSLVRLPIPPLSRCQKCESFSSLADSAKKKKQRRKADEKRIRNREAAIKAKEYDDSATPWQAITWKLLKIKPNFASGARDELKKWYDDGPTDFLIGGLRKAGLEILAIDV